MDEELAWFRAGVRYPWHVVSARIDLELLAACGYSRSWTRSQQERSAVVPGPACPACLVASGLKPAKE